MTKHVDLDRLDALHAALGKRKWRFWKGYGISDQRGSTLYFGGDPGPLTDAVIALHNAYPAISRELRLLRQTLREVLIECGAIDHWATCTGSDDQLEFEAFAKACGKAWKVLEGGKGGGNGE